MTGPTLEPWQRQDGSASWLAWNAAMRAGERPDGPAELATDWTWTASASRRFGRQTRRVAAESTSGGT